MAGQQVSYICRLQVPGWTVNRTKDWTVKTTRTFIEEVPHTQTDMLIDYTIDISELKAFGMKANFACTIETNSGSSPQETFTLADGIPVFWIEGETAIFAGDVTALYVTTDPSNSGTLEIISALSTAT